MAVEGASHVAGGVRASVFRVFCAAFLGPAWLRRPHPRIAPSRGTDGPTSYVFGAAATPWSARTRSSGTSRTLDHWRSLRGRGAFPPSFGNDRLRAADHEHAAGVSCGIRDRSRRPYPPLCPFCAAPYLRISRAGQFQPARRRCRSSSGGVPECSTALLSPTSAYPHSWPSNADLRLPRRPDHDPPAGNGARNRASPRPAPSPLRAARGARAVHVLVPRGGLPAVLSVVRNTRGAGAPRVRWLGAAAVKRAVFFRLRLGAAAQTYTGPGRPNLGRGIETTFNDIARNLGADTKHCTQCMWRALGWGRRTGLAAVAREVGAAGLLAARSSWRPIGSLRPKTKAGTVVEGWSWAAVGFLRSAVTAPAAVARRLQTTTAGTAVGGGSRAAVDLVHAAMTRRRRLVGTLKPAATGT